MGRAVSGDRPIGAASADQNPPKCTATARETVRVGCQDHLLTGKRIQARESALPENRRRGDVGSKACALHTSASSSRQRQGGHGRGQQQRGGGGGNETA